jgi:hypothetical protein
VFVAVVVIWLIAKAWAYYERDVQRELYRQRVRAEARRRNRKRKP